VRRQRPQPLHHPDLFLPAVKQPRFFLTGGPPPTAGGPGDVQTYQGHVWRRADSEALFDPAPPGARAARPPRSTYTTGPRTGGSARWSRTPG
jgi:hypothetical protein